MFGLLKKSDFDAENIFIKSQISSSANDIQDKLSFLTNELFKTQEQLRQNQNIILDLKNVIEKLNNVQSQQNNNSIKSFKKNIDFNALAQSIENFVKNRSGISESAFNEIIQQNKKLNVLDFKNFTECQIQGENLGPEATLTNHIHDYLTQNNFNYIPQYRLNINDQSLRADLFIEDEICVEIKRWDLNIQFKESSNNALRTLTDYGTDRWAHYRDLDRLSHYKVKNPNKRCVFISVTENAKNEFSKNNNQNTCNFYSDNNITFGSDKYANKIHKSEDKNKEKTEEETIIAQNWLKIYAENQEFNFEYKDNQTGIFLSRKCKVLVDTIVDNMSNIPKDLINKYLDNDIYLAQLPTNWRIRIIEVL